MTTGDEPAEEWLLRYTSATEHGKALLRSAAERAGLPPRLGTSPHGLDLVAFTAHVAGQPPGRRPGGAGTRTLGPMQIDADLLARVDTFAARHNVSRRRVVESLVEELVGKIGELP